MARNTIRRTWRLGGAFDAGDQFGPPCPAAAAVVAHTGEEIAERHGALTLGAVRLVNHGRLTAAVALDAEEPRREGAQRFGQCLGRRRERIVAIAAPMPARGPAGQSFLAQLLGDLALEPT